MFEQRQLLSTNPQRWDVVTRVLDAEMPSANSYAAAADRRQGYSHCRNLRRWTSLIFYTTIR